MHTPVGLINARFHVPSTLKGLIWGGTPPPRTSRSLCSSPVRARTPPHRGKGASLFGSSWDGGLSELERSRGVGSAKRCRPPSPARCRQMEADNARYDKVFVCLTILGVLPLKRPLDPLPEIPKVFTSLPRLAIFTTAMHGRVEQRIRDSFVRLKSVFLA